MPDTPVEWMAPQVTAPGFVGFSRRLTQLSDGNVLVTFASDTATGPGSPAGDDILGVILDPGGAVVRDTFRLNSASTAQDENGPDVAALPGGGFVLSYAEQEIGGNVPSRVRAQVHDDAGAVLRSVTVAGPNTDEYYLNTRVTPLSATRALVTWETHQAGTSMTPRCRAGSSTPRPGPRWAAGSPCRKTSRSGSRAMTRSR
jgi:hypothetical protein